MTKTDTIEAGIRAALELAEARSWSSLTLAEIASKAGLGLEDFHPIGDKMALAAHLDSYFDKSMSEGSLDDEDTPRTRLFDVLMFRFDAMETVRDGMVSFMRWRDRTAPGLAMRVKSRLETARWALNCAGLDGLPAPTYAAQLAGVAWAIGRAEAAWRSETSADLSRTMAALDRELVKAERRAKWVSPSKNRDAEPEAESPEN